MSFTSTVSTIAQLDAAIVSADSAGAGTGSNTIIISGATRARARRIDG
jgi:microcompartment protein CcmK/EutM